MKFALPIAAAAGALIAVMVWKMASEPEVARNRPGVQRDKTVAKIRQNFAAKSYDAVIVDANMLLESGADDVTAHLYLAMAACGKSDEASALRHWQQPPAERKAFAARKCKMLGIPLAE